MAAIFTPALSKDGLWGKTSVKAMQRFMQYYGYYPKGYLIDGLVGYWTARGMQLWVRANGFYPASKYKIDGDDGPATWAAIIKLVDKHFTHISGMEPPYSNWVPYHYPNTRDGNIAMLQFWLNDFRFPRTSA